MQFLFNELILIYDVFRNINTFLIHKKKSNYSLFLDRTPRVEFIAKL